MAVNELEQVEKVVRTFHTLPNDAQSYTIGLLERDVARARTEPARRVLRRKRKNGKPSNKTATAAE